MAWHAHYYGMASSLNDVTQFQLLSPPWKMADQLVEGIGDEVLLFGTFLFLSLCMVGYMSFRGARRHPEQNARAEGEEEGLLHEGI